MPAMSVQSGLSQTFCIIVFVTWLATKIGKRRAFFCSTGISLFGYALKWFCYDPEYPLMLFDTGTIPLPLV